MTMHSSIGIEYSGGIGGGTLVSPSDCLLLRIICSPKKYFFYGMRLVRVYIGGQKKSPGILYTSD